MKDKVVINYKQSATQGGRPGDALTPPGKKKTRYLHDNRISDSLIEYMESLER
jgi:hypothetical protein